MRSFPLTTGSPGNSTYLGLRYREDTDILPFFQFFFKVEPDGFTDIYHQLIESFPLRENIDTYAPAAPVFSVGINFKFDEHESTSVIWYCTVLHKGRKFFCQGIYSGSVYFIQHPGYNHTFDAGVAAV